MGQMTAVRQVHGQHRVAGIEQREVRSHVRLAARMGLNIGKAAGKQTTGPLDRESLDHVHVRGAPNNNMLLLDAISAAILPGTVPGTLRLVLYCAVYQVLHAHCRETYQAVLYVCTYEYVQYQYNPFVAVHGCSHGEKVKFTFRIDCGGSKK